jgi:hypothetical protein
MPSDFERSPSPPRPPRNTSPHQRSQRRHQQQEQGEDAHQQHQQPQARRHPLQQHWQYTPDLQMTHVIEAPQHAEEAYAPLMQLRNLSEGQHGSLYGSGPSALQPLEDWARSVSLSELDAFLDPTAGRPAAQTQPMDMGSLPQQMAHGQPHPRPWQPPTDKAESKAVALNGLEAAAHLLADPRAATLPALRTNDTSLEGSPERNYLGNTDLGSAPSSGDSVRAGAIFPVAAWLSQAAYQLQQRPAKATVRVPSRAARVICSTDALLAHFQRCTRVEILTRCSEPKQSDSTMTELLVRGTHDAVLHASAVLVSIGKALNEHESSTAGRAQGASTSGATSAAADSSARKRATSLGDANAPHDGAHDRGRLRHLSAGHDGDDTSEADPTADWGQPETRDDWTAAAHDSYRQTYLSSHRLTPSEKEPLSSRANPLPRAFSPTISRSGTPLSLPSQSLGAASGYTGPPGPRSPLSNASAAHDARWRGPAATVHEADSECDVPEEETFEDDGRGGSSIAAADYPGGANIRHTPSPVTKGILVRRRSASLRIPSLSDNTVPSGGRQLDSAGRRRSSGDSDVAAKAAARQAAIFSAAQARHLAPARQRAYVLVDNSNIFIGAQLNGNVRDLSIRVNIRALCQIVEGSLPCVFRGVEGSNSGGGRIWREWSNNGYSVFLAGRRSERSSEATLMHHIQTDAPDDAENILVLVTGDGSESQASSSFTRLATAAATRGWVIHIWSWEQSLSGKFRELKQRFSDNIKILSLDSEKGKITFRAGQSATSSGGSGMAAGETKEGGSGAQGGGRRTRAKAVSDPLPRAGRTRGPPLHGSSFDLGQLSQQQEQRQHQRQQQQQQQQQQQLLLLQPTHYHQQQKQQQQYHQYTSPMHSEHLLSPPHLPAHLPSGLQPQELYGYGAPPSLLGRAAAIPASNRGIPQSAAALHFQRAMSLETGSEYQRQTDMGQVLWGQVSKPDEPRRAAVYTQDAARYEQPAQLARVAGGEGPELIWAQNPSSEEESHFGW